MAKLFEIFKTLSDKTRLEIVLELWKSGEMSCQDISIRFKNLTQPTISHHFKVLEDKKIISTKKVGTAHFYSLNKKTLLDAGIDLKKIK
jgi:ArsR family transcriptional regulator